MIVAGVVLKAAMRKILGGHNLPLGAASHLSQLRLAITLLFLVLTLPAWGEETKTEFSIERDYSIHEILERYEQQSGRLVRLGGVSLPGFNIRALPNELDFPNSIESLTDFLGIENYATVLNEDSAETELIVLQVRPRTSKRLDQEQSTKGSEKRLRDAAPDSPVLSTEEQALVYSIYEESEEHGPDLDAVITRIDRRILNEENSFGEPYLTVAEEQKVLRIYENSNVSELVSEKPEPLR